MRIKRWWLIGLVGLLVLSSGLVSMAAEPVVKEWEIPSIVYLSGPWAAFGLETKWAMDTAVEDVNAAGGIRGIPLKLTWYDDGFDTAKAVQQTSRALSQKPLMLLGPQADIPQAAGLPLCAKEGVFSLTGIGVCSYPVQNDHWGTCLFDEMRRTNQPSAKYWAEKHKGEITSVIIFMNLVSSVIEEQADGIKEVLAANGVKVLPYLEVPPDTVNFKSIALKAINSGANGFICITGPDQAAKLTIALRQNGVKEGFRIWNYYGCDAPPLYEIAKGFLEDTYVNGVYDPNFKGERWQALVKRYQEYKEDPNTVPTFAVPVSYNLPWIVKQTFEACQITGDPAKLKEEREKIRDYILNLKDFDGIQGKITVIRDMGGALHPTFMFQIKDNKPVMVAMMEPLPYEGPSKK